MQESTQQLRQELGSLSKALTTHLELFQSFGLDHMELGPLVSKATLPRKGPLQALKNQPRQKKDAMSKETSLEQLATEAERCTLCQLSKTRNKLVFGAGNENPDLVFVGEAPGAKEDETGQPFVGRAGKLLDKMLVYMGLSRDLIYIMNTLKCRPPENRNPTRLEMDNCKPFFDTQLDLLKPKAIVALGSFATQRLLDTEVTIGRLRGRFHDYNGIPVMPTYHPAYILRSPSEANRAKVKSDLRLVAERFLGKREFEE